MDIEISKDSAFSHTHACKLLETVYNTEIGQFSFLWVTRIYPKYLIAHMYICLLSLFKIIWMDMFSHPGTMMDGHAWPTTITLKSSRPSLVELMKPKFSSAPWRCCRVRQCRAEAKCLTSRPAFEQTVTGGRKRFGPLSCPSLASTGIH